MFAVHFSFENIPASEILSSNYQFSLKIGEWKEISGRLSSIKDKFEQKDAKQYMLNNKITAKLTMIIKYVGHPRMRNKHPIGFNTDPVFSNMIVNSVFTDFKFIVKGKEFKVHKSVLAATSPMLRKMFTTDMAENKDGESQIDHIEPEVFDAMLKFIYRVEAPSGADFCDLYAAAHYFEIEALKAICEQEVHTNLTVDNAPDIFLWAYPYEELEDLKYDAWDVVKM